MAKRNLALFKKTAVEPEVLDDENVSHNVSLPDDSERLALLSTVPPDHIPPLSQSEIKRRMELEDVVTNNFKAFYDVGCALREIQERKLYRNTHDRFQEYLKDLWDLARSRAYQLIESATVVDNLLEDLSVDDVQANVQNFGQTTFLPKNDSQARALVKYDPETQRTVWQEAIKTAPNGKITASHIKKTAKVLNLEQVRDSISKAKKAANRAPKISEDFRKAYNAFFDQINIERASNWRYTNRKEVVTAMQVCLDAIQCEL